jgi:hypothetical protein
MLNQRNCGKSKTTVQLLMLSSTPSEKRTTGKPVRLTALLDSGGSGSMICAKHTSDLKKTSESEATTWSTPAGDLSTKESCNADSTAGTTVLQRNRMEVPCGTVVRNYDMIIGRDMLTDLGIDIRQRD